MSLWIVVMGSFCLVCQSAGKTSTNFHCSSNIYTQTKKKTTILITAPGYSKEKMREFSTEL